MPEITLDEFLDGYKTNLIRNVVFIGNTVNCVYGRRIHPNTFEPETCELVWATVP